MIRRPRLFDGFEQLLHHLIGPDSLRVRVKIGEQTMPQHRLGHRPHVVATDVQPPVENRDRLGAQNEVLRRPGPRAHVSQSFTNEGVCFSLGRVALTRFTA